MPRNPTPSYSNTRLTFRREVIEPLQAEQVFRVETRVGVFEMSKADFLKTFSHVAETKCYREQGYFNYPKVPAKAKRYLVVAHTPTQGGPYPEETEASPGLPEGALQTIKVNAYERNRSAREKCVRHHGCACSVCGILMSDRYGEVAWGFIHVHHLRQLSTIAKEYLVDPIQDLRPVCPNCHAVIHMKTPAYTIEEARNLLQKDS
jgi:hypothetical protein